MWCWNKYSKVDSLKLYLNVFYIMLKQVNMDLNSKADWQRVNNWIIYCFRLFLSGISFSLLFGPLIWHRLFSIILIFNLCKATAFLWLAERSCRWKGQELSVERSNLTSLLCMWQFVCLLNDLSVSSTCWS